MPVYGDRNGSPFWYCVDSRMTVLYCRDIERPLSADTTTSKLEEKASLTSLLTNPRGRVSFVLDLRAERYRFYTLRHEFLTHVPHPRNLAKDTASAHHSGLMRLLLDKQEQQLTQVYHDPRYDPSEGSLESTGLTCRHGAR